ncbi:enoyl-CoA hydratase/isomerase family protein [Demequina flava]|uniref:enoyl-CoA hydratase/isomerase family protein n=1 Tax=Demequina flava TaxID=1095025 RepID=UPI001F23DD33
MNAIDFEGGRAYRDAVLAAVEADDVRAIVLSAEGPAFCAGGDVLAMAGLGASSSDVTQAAHVIHEGIQSLVSCAKPVVAAVHGAVAGGGIGLMLAADYIVAAPSLRVAGKYADIGLTPDLGVSTLLTRAVGERRALEMLLTSRDLDASTAQDWGLINEIVDDPDARAAQIAQQWSTGASAALGHAARLVRASADRSFGESLRDEAHSIGQAYGTPEAQARIAAFAAKQGQRS